MAKSEKHKTQRKKSNPESGLYFPLNEVQTPPQLKPHCRRRPRQAVRQEEGHGERHGPNPTADFEANCGLSWEFRILQF